MKHLAPLMIAALLMVSPGMAQSEKEIQRADEIRNRVRQKQPVSPEERAFVHDVQQRRNAKWAKNHPPRDSTGLIPLPELGKSDYKGEQGGLYPGGASAPPIAHANAGLEIANAIKPLDAEGRESANGKIVMISTGMSNTTMESQALVAMLTQAQGVNPKFQFVDCAQGGQAARTTADAGANYWKVSDERLSAAGATGKQVQVAWLKQANISPSAEFPEEVKKLQADLLATVHNLRDKYPNIKIVYLSSRIYAGYAISPLNPEPHAYEGGFAVKWLIADQIAGRAQLNYNPAKGAVKAPWLAWGPYLWADGTKPRADGLTYKQDDLVENDRTHPSTSGREKVAKQLLDFLQKDPTAAPWFKAN